MQDRTGALRKCHLPAGADEHSVATLAPASRSVRHGRGTALFMVGDEPDGLHGVRPGLVRTWISDEAGREWTLALMEPGNPFGEFALRDGLPRSANATALEPTDCLLTPPASLDTALTDTRVEVRAAMTRNHVADGGKDRVDDALQHFGATF